jgi:Legume lectin domain
MRIVAALVGLVATLVMASAGLGAGVNFSDFSSVAGLSINGDSAKVGDELRLTEEQAEQVGSVFTKHALINPAKSFKSKFKARISATDPESAGDGMAFLLQPGPKDAIGPGVGGEDLGYADIAPSLAIELDIFQNFDIGDPNDNHIAVHLNGDSSAAEETATPTFDLLGGTTTVWVQYSASKQKLKIFAARGNNRPSNPLIVYDKRLASLFPGADLRAGFTAATGADVAEQSILSWSLKQGH